MSPRIGIVTTRLKPPHFSCSALYDLEDAFCQSTRGKLIHLPISAPDVAGAPTVMVPQIEEGLDLLMIGMMYMVPGQFNLEVVANWRKHCKRVVAYLFDAWPRPSLAEFVKNSFVNEVDLLVVSFYESLQFYRDLLPIRVIWLPQAINPERFHSHSRPRPIFCAAMGRQEETFFGKMRKYCAARDVLFAYQDIIGNFRRSWVESYDLYASLLRNSKYVLNWSGKPMRGNWATEFKIDPVTCRWFESAAAGCIQVGSFPESPVLSSLFPGMTLVDVRDFNADPEEVFTFLESQSDDLMKAQAEILSGHVRTRHSWYNRVHAILAELGMEEIFNPPTTIPLDLSPLKAPAKQAA